MKFLKSISLLTVVIFCLLMSAGAFAEDGPIDPFFAEIQTYTLKPRLRSDRSDLTVSVYVPSDIVTGTPATFTASVSGGSGEYTYCFEVMTIDYIDDDNIIHPIVHYTQHKQYSSSDSFSYTFCAPGYYIINVIAKDSNGLTGSNFIMNIEVTGENFLEAKISEIIGACPTGGDFEKAVWLHDYLTHHAYYDKTYSLYSEIGVLMEGTGVCDSYVRAYNILLSRVGIGGIRVVSETHAWNAVNMEDAWYHVDSTWDDPTTGNAAADAVPESGNETHEFFGLTSDIIEQISEHVIENTNEVPLCTDFECNYAVRTCDVAWQESLEADIGEEIAAGGRNFTLTLTGSYSWKVGDTIYTRNLSHPVINYGISRYLLERDGLEYRDRAMNLTVAYDVTAPLVMDISAHFSLNDTASVLALPSGLQALEAEVLERTNAVVVVIPDGCESIGNLALAYMPNLDEVHIPDSVTVIESDTFADCKPNLLIVTPKNSAAADFAVDEGFCVEFAE